jgi:hypothetical protein
MPITMNSFTCPNGHHFDANAKLRARCSDCGDMARRDFNKLSKVVESKITVEKIPPVKTPVLLRQGRARLPIKKELAVEKKPVIVKKTIRKSVGTTRTAAAGLVKSRRITTRGSMPVVNRKPPKTAIARGIQGHEVTKPYWHSVADKYGL